MAGQYDATVTAFYLAYYGRPADPAGLAFWSQALESSGGDFSAIVDAFSTSTEATDHFGTGTPADRVTAIYQQLFSRAPDQAGLDYWLGALETGNVNLGDIAIQIVGGAQAQDLALSTLRQEVATQFTAAVTASGVAYDGAAAIEAARVLMAAVTTATGADQIKSLVAASTALVQTAHDNPAIIATLAADGKLSAVLATTSGQADPVGAINALTSIAKAAAADPAALATLQQGGGVTGLLNSLPAGTSLVDLGAAVDKGGLGAAVEITRPPVATVPDEPPPPGVPRVRLVEDTGVDTTDKVSANGKLQVSGVEDGATWQYSADNGKTWTTGATAVGGVATLDTSGTGAHALLFRAVGAGGASDVTAFHYTIAPTIAFSGPDGKDLPTDTLTANSLYFFVHIAGRAAGTQAAFQVSATGKDGSWTTADESVQLPDGQYYIRYLVTDTDGKVSPTNALKLVMDQSKPWPTVELVEDTGLSATDRITKNGQVKIGGLGAGETWTYSFDNGKTWTKGTTGSDGTAIVDAGTSGAQSLLVRTYDKADGNAFTQTQFKYTVQDKIAPTMAFAGPDGKDSGSDTLTVNSTDYMVNVYGSKTSVSHDFQVSDTGKDGSWVSTSDSALLPDGLHYIRYVFTDAAGNVGATNALKLVVDTVAPAQGLKLASVEGGAPGSNHTDLAHADVVFSYTGTLDLDKAEALFYILGTKGDWSLADKQIDRVAKTVTFKDIDLSHGDATIMLESKDAAGNTLRLVQPISGPFTTFTAKAADDGIVLRANKDGNVYLVDGDDVVQVATDAKSGGALAGIDVKLGVQQSAVQGILGVGPSDTVHFDHAGITYSLGTDGADTLAGNYVWAYDGDDTIQAAGNPANDAYHQLGVVYGGKGSDTIHAGAGGSWFLYRSPEESTVVADDQKAHGFDTVFFGTGAADAAHTQVFDFAVTLDGTYMPIASAKPLTGAETGAELLALLNAALVQNDTVTFPGHGKVSGTFIDFAVAGGGHENYLVVDADGNGTIDGADYVVKLVGTIDAAASVYIDKTGTISFLSA